MVCFFCLFGFPEGFYKANKNLSRKPTIQKTTKEHQKNLRENQQIRFFKGFRPTLGYVFFVCLVFPKVFTKPTKTFEKTKNTNENQRNTTKHVGKTKQTKLLKVSDPPLDMFFGFPEGFYKSKKTFEKTKNTKDNQRKPKKPSGKQQKNTVFQGFRPTLGYVFWFSRRFLQSQKNLSRKPKIQKKTTETFGKTKNKVVKGFRPTLGYGFGCFVCLVFPKVVFLLVFFGCRWYLWYSRRFFLVL